MRHARPGLVLNGTMSDPLPVFDRNANCFTALRLGFALMVVAGHSWELGGHGPDPAQRLLGVTLGEIGVNSFFALSGVLVTQSWQRSSSAGSYFLKRALRILPGFWVCLLVTSMVGLPLLGAHLKGNGWMEQLQQGDFLGYLIRNSLLRVRQTGAGGLFAENPAAFAVNGALWSLFPEALCYVALAAVATLSGLKAGRMHGLIVAFCGLYVIHALAQGVFASAAPQAWQSKLWYVGRLCTQAVYFFSGALVCVHARLITRRSLWLGMGLLIGTSLMGYYVWTAPFLLPWILAGAGAQLAAPMVERVGDFSYGVYLYHYPIQQSLVALHLDQRSPWALFFISALLALVPAALSWFLIEHPALNLKARSIRTSTAATSP